MRNVESQSEQAFGCVVSDGEDCCGGAGLDRDVAGVDRFNATESASTAVLELDSGSDGGDGMAEAAVSLASSAVCC